MDPSHPGTPREQFLDQFAPDGSDWLYRYRMTGPAYRVTGDEKNRLVVAFDRMRRRWMLWAMLPFLIYLAFAVMVFTVPGVGPWVSQNFPGGDTRDNGVMLLAVCYGLLGIGHRRAMYVPVRALAKRTPVAPAWPREARQRFALERLPLTVVVGAATVAFLLLLYFALERPSIGPKSIVLIAAAIAALGWAIVQGARKYRLERADHAASNLT